MDLNNNPSVSNSGKMKDPKNVHIRLKNGLKIKCKMCKKSFLPEILKKHKRISHPNVKISIKGKTLKKHKLLKQSTKSKDGGFDCIYCNRKFSYKHHLKRHMQESCGAFKCEVCNKHYASQDLLNLHSQAAHMLPKDQKKHKLLKQSTKSENGGFDCIHCNKKISTKKNLERHIQESCGAFKCEVCNKHYASQDLLNLHLRAAHMLPKKAAPDSIEKIEWEIVHPNENGLIKCLDCKQTFTKRSYARTHHREFHMKENRFICQVCDKSFTVKDYLKLHVQSAHMLPKIVNDGLTKKLEWKIVQANEDGKFSCLECKQTFSAISNARQHHKDLHMRENKYICEVCDRSFIVEDYLKIHVQGAHMLPKLADDTSGMKLEWKLVTRNENGRINCHDCRGKYSTSESVIMPRWSVKSSISSLTKYKRSHDQFYYRLVRSKGLLF